jgi:hypothetical protein
MTPRATLAAREDRLPVLKQVYDTPALVQTLKNNSGG